MAIDRRALLLGLGASGALSLTAFADTRGEAAFVACTREADGNYAAVVLDADANVLFSEGLDARGHDAAIAPDGRTAVVFARRPGRFAIVLDLVARRRSAAITPPPDRVFAGHGVFSPDGRLLYATENDFEAARGVLGLYETQTFRRVGEIPTHGVGPHEAILLSDNHTLAIANGGIETHPDYPREKLNLATMEPNLALVDSATGDLIGKAGLPRDLHQLSIRHMSETADGSLWFGGQYQGPITDSIPLVGSFDRDGAISLVDAPDGVYRDLNQYIGSVSTSRDGRRVVTASPRGGSYVVWDTASRTVIEQRSVTDVCGTAPDSAGFLISDGTGRLWRDDRLLSASDRAFDHHIAFRVSG
ncbi:MAG: DUF1513 domain-containing protein [Rhodobiaceae bacterium]|nr:DUF1513 domain-containing protein [Rhodobiaceae bacterium]